MFKGEIPKDMFVCHTCDNRICVNPKHLFVGSALDNVRDAMSKGRMVITGRPITKEAKSRGGKTTFKRYGLKFIRNAQAVFKQKWDSSEEFRDKTRKMLSSRGKKILKKYGSSHFSKLGKMSALSRKQSKKV